MNGDVDRAAALVFVGPSVPRRERPRPTGLEYRPPIRRGDLPLIARAPRPPAAIGIVDGVFDQTLAVSPREVLELLALGIPVYGAASMGALRATELFPCGMIGVGRVFELYRDEIVVAEDEVAVIFDEDREVCLTEPLVNVRCSVEALVARGRMEAATAAAVVAAAAALPYADRTYRTIARQVARDAGVDIERLLPALREHDQKKLDALALIEALARGAPR